MSPKMIADEIIFNVNSFIKENDSFSKTALEDELKQLKCPYWSKVIQFLNEAKVFKQIDYNLYTIDKEIINSNLVSIIEKYKIRKNKQLRFSRNKKLTSSQKANLDVMDIERACKIVRSFGYKIFKEI